MRAMNLSAETAYLFRHAVIRDAAYELLPPTVRGGLHGLALGILEGVVDTFPQDVRDAWCEELADHAVAACDAEGADREKLRRRELDFLQRGAEYESRHWHNERSIQLRARIAEHPFASDVQKLQALMDLIETLVRSGGPNRTLPYLDAAQELAECLGDKQKLALAALARAQTAFLTGRNPDAQKLNAQAHRLAMESGDATLEARVLINMAGVAQGSGDWATGERSAKRAWELLQPDGQPVSLARTKLYLGDSCWQQGRLSEAEEHFRAALQIYRDAQNIAGEASARDHLGSLLHELGRDDEAKREHERAGDVYAAIGDPVGHGSALSNLATVLLGEGRIEDAYRYRKQALRNFRNAGALYMEGVGLGNLGGIERELGLLEQASLSFQRARDLLRKAGRVVEQAVFEANFGQLLLLLGFHDAARVNANQARNDLLRVDAVNWCAQYVTPLEVRLDIERALAGSADAMREANERLINMRRLVKDGDRESGMGRAIGKLEQLMAEAQKPDPLLLRGHQVSELQAPLRLALLDRMQRVEPERWEKLQGNPALLNALRDGTDGLSVPDWESVAAES